MFGDFVLVKGDSKRGIPFFKSQKEQEKGSESFRKECEPFLKEIQRARALSEISARTTIIGV